MTITLDGILKSLESLCDKEVCQASDFGIEFGTYAPEKIKSSNVKCITVSPFVNLKLIHFMNENKSNLAITGIPLSFRDNHFPLSEIDFEMMKSLVNNNIKTINLSEPWIHSQKGGFSYLLQTLGFTKIGYTSMKLSSEKTISNWSIPSIRFNDFITSLSHLTKNWLSYSLAPEESEMSFVFDNQSLSQFDIEEIKKRGISNLVGFAFDSRKLQQFQKYKMNYLYIPFIEFYNISLRKFSQVLQLETNEQVLFYAQKNVEWITDKKI